MFILIPEEEGLAQVALNTKIFNTLEEAKKYASKKWEDINPDAEKLGWQVEVTGWVGYNEEMKVVYVIVEKEVE